MATLTDLTTPVTLRADFTLGGKDIGADTTDTVTWTATPDGIVQLSATTGNPITITGFANGTAEVTATNGTFTTAPVSEVVALVPDGLAIVENPTA